MSSSAAQVQPGSAVALEPQPQHYGIGAKWLLAGDARLDAAFYATAAVAARRAVVQSGCTVRALGDRQVTSALFWPDRFRRVYTTDRKEGLPFLQASQALMFRPTSDKWVAKAKVPPAQDYIAHEGWILVTRSGVVGRCVLVTLRLAQFYLSEDLIRVASVVPEGYLYAYLSSWVGQALMTREEYGATVSHLEPHHLAGIPVPLLPDGQQQIIHDRVMQSCRLRDEANNLLDEADGLLYRELGLAPFDDTQIPYIRPADDDGVARHPKAFSMKASLLSGRFDVSFHLPLARACVSQMEKGKYPLVKLGALAEPYVAPRFRRIYVERKHGVPFLQGSHIPERRPYDLKYLSRTAHKDLTPWTIQAGWVLVTCSGTVGRVAVATRAHEGWAASQHIERIIPIEGRSHAGYLAAFLMTPYGQLQLTSKIYGGVVDELTAGDTAAVWLPDAPTVIQERIGKLVVEAFEKKEQANVVEDDAISDMETAIGGRPVQVRASPANSEA
jgi:type I restriction enzyme S subunit